MKLHSLFRYCAVAVVLMMTAGTSGLRAQSFEPFSPYGIFSPSVESYQMTRCGNLLPSLYTGAMTFSLPLMTYSDPDFTIPVILEYSFDGYKPGQHSGSVGYGWYLDCGGVITREVRGIPDEGDLDGGSGYECPIYGWRQAGIHRHLLETQPDRIISIRRRPEDHSSTEAYIGLLTGYNPFTDNPMYADPLGPGQGYSLYDTAPDIYHFRFLGHSGDFMMLPDGTVRVYNSDIPYGEVSVHFTDYAGNPCFATITLTTGDGYEYRFDAEGVSETPNDWGDHPLRPSRSVSAYRLTGIEAPNHRKVLFTYDNYYTPALSYQYGSFLEGGYLTQGIYETDNQQGAISPEFEIRRSFIREAAACLKKVSVFDAGAMMPADSILLGYATAPDDERAASCFEPGSLPSGFVPEDTAPVLVSVSMYGEDGLADFASFSYQGAPAGTPKTFLRSVTGMRTGTYSFSYALDGFTLPHNDTQGTDHWGYWNGSSISDLRRHLTDTEWMFSQGGEIESIVLDEHTDSTYVVILPDTTFVRRYASHLYDQMTDAVKEATPALSLCGALTEIHYPHGGKTVVEYEPNRVARRINVRSTETSRVLEQVDSLDEDVTWIVGGVRVRRLIDSADHCQQDTTCFSYIDPDAGNRCSGILMAMPKYTETAQYSIHVNSLEASYGVAGVATVNAIGFNNCCGFVLNRDPHVVYPAVIVTHPDRSTTEHRFTSVDDIGFEDEYSGGWTVTKHILGTCDEIEPKGRTPSCMIPASLDCKNLRGQPKSTVVRTAAAQELSRTEYVYSYDQVTVPRVGFNNILTFNLAPYTVRSPRLVSMIETERGVTLRTDRSYNALGQISVISTVGGNGAAAGDTLRMRLRYRHETGDTSRFRTLPEAAARTLALGTDEYLLAREHYSYKPGTPRISGILSYAPDYPVIIPSQSSAFYVAAGTPRVSAFQYGPDQRLTGVSLPGEATLNYTWDGTRLTSKSVNGTPNITTFAWKDLVGLTQVTDPSGQVERYEYDARNRPWKTFDTDSLTVSVYYYKLKNE